jgi:hypothetical protein
MLALPDVCCQTKHSQVLVYRPNMAIPAQRRPYRPNNSHTGPTVSILAQQRPCRPNGGHRGPTTGILAQRRAYWPNDGNTGQRWPYWPYLFLPKSSTIQVLPFFRKPFLKTRTATLTTARPSSTGRPATCPTFSSTSETKYQFYKTFILRP